MDSPLPGPVKEMAGEMVVCSGAPKSGTHLLLKAVSLFGGHINQPEHAHEPYWHKNPRKKYINIKRNPRNVLMSWLRFNVMPLNEKTFIKELPAVVAEGFTYVPWLADTDTLTVSFESLVADPAELGKISEFISKPLISGHFDKLWGRTKTFTGQLSDWRDHWTPAVQAEWERCRGIELEKALDYRN